MHLLDWTIMLGTLLGIVAYGVIKTRNINNVQSYLLGDRDLKWWTIGLSVMATQASAITFLSTPGQAYIDGMGFAQFYFGLPIAMVILCVFFLPIYYNLKVYTAYEYLEGRFDLKTRSLTAILFLVQRGLAAGITIYAPAIILSTILGWSLNITVFSIGLIVIFYTVAGGTKAVSVTQKQQMIIILTGMVIAAIIIVNKLPEDISFVEALGVAGKMEKLNVVDLNFDLSNRYNLWSGILGGVFLFLSYFGTDQSQVQRYLSGKSLAESRLGLLFNGILKVPMQFLILFVGVMVFVFFLFVKPPLHFNASNVEKLQESEVYADYESLNQQHDQVFAAQQAEINALVAAMRTDDQVAIAEAKEKVIAMHKEQKELRVQAGKLIEDSGLNLQHNDKDYVFITFIMNYLPIGLIGLLLAVIFSAAMSSTASELNALATTTVIDIYKRSLVKDREDQHYLKVSKWITIMWGGIALFFAVTASLFENLIQAVNIIGSLFYGVILGIFMVAFFLKKVKGSAVFIAAIIGEACILSLWYLDKVEAISISYLWFNPIGCFLVMIMASIIQGMSGDSGSEAAAA